MSNSSRPDDELEATADLSGVSTSASGIGPATERPPLTTRAAAMLGRVISGRYRIVEPIAHGGMGTVFRGDHLHMRKRVAIKILHAETEGLPGLVAQFEREAIAGAHITHPNVAIATDFGELEDGSYFLVLEYVKGATLSDVLKDGPMPQDRVVHIAKQIASALHSVHEMGIVHRDLKPGNIMLQRGSGDQAKLIDFGFAKVPVDRISADVGHEFSEDRKTISDPDTVFG
ncbi:MAG TPA: serine/threonine-protein kinase, partial [Polyangiaceae bacterium]|nr:serine/threonine-protein kinase [Polyangiaceae bacterium]